MKLKGSLFSAGKVLAPACLLHDLSFTHESTWFFSVIHTYPFALDLGFENLTCSPAPHGKDLRGIFIIY